MTPRRIAALALLGCIAFTRSAEARATQLDLDRFAARVNAITQQAAPARLGVAVLVPESSARWSLHGDERFPMQSVFKGPLGAFVLARAEQGGTPLDSVLTLTEADLSTPYSAVGDSFAFQRRYPVGELVQRAVSVSDNTAADVLLAITGGPHALTDWLQSHGIRGIRVDRSERELQPWSIGLGPFERAWTDDDTLQAAIARVPEQQRMAATQRYLADARDTMTPNGAVDYLDALESGKLLSPKTTAWLLEVMAESPTGPQRLRAGLPRGATLAHKTGTGRTVLGLNTAVNDVGIVTLKDGRRFILAVLFSESRAGSDAREAVLARVARAAVQSLH